MTSRGPRLPSLPGDGDTVQILSDLHFESVPYYPQHWHGLLAADLHRMVGATAPVAWAFCGDATSDNNPTDRVRFVQWWTETVPEGLPSVVVAGNHDIPVSPWPQPVCVDAGKNLRILGLQPAPGATGPGNTPLTVAAETLAWAADRCAETTRKVVVIFHAPLRDTVNPVVVPEWWQAPSTWSWQWHANDPPGGPTIADFVAAHPNVVAWVGGHTHSPVWMPGMVTPVQYGTTRLAAVAASSPVPLPRYPDQPACVTCQLTVHDDRVVVRYRDHEAQQWLAPTYTVHTGG